MSASPSLYWLRRDLRVTDNPALAAALQAGPTVALYILDEATPWPLGAASRWWLHHALAKLAPALARLGVTLILRRGNPAEIVPAIISELGATRLFASRVYSQPEIKRDKQIAKTLEADGVACRDFNASLLREPWEVKTQTGGYYKVYGPYSRALMEMGVDAPASAPKPQAMYKPAIASDDLDSWNLLPTHPDWATGFADWQPGEDGAHRHLQRLLETAMRHYADGRDKPGRDFTSRLSAHLALGDISPRQIWHAVHATGEIDVNRATFLKELVWREFAAHTLYHQPHLPDQPLDGRFAAFPWRDDKAQLKAWQQGQTGYPIVDAGMRQLWQTGWMHNRVRMIVASFLIKHLLLRWQAGERWFWDTLVDADLASNSFNWQWVAGCGADAAPYFRIFNPMLQGSKFDPDGAYVRSFVPELAKLPDKYIHAPWQAPPAVLQAAGIVLGRDYPAPIVDHAAARARALAGFQSLRTE